MFRNCLRSLHLLLGVFLLDISASAQVYRAPANFVPDDDMILVPIIVERSIIEDFHKKHEARFVQARRKLKHWQTQEEYARDYGLEDSNFITLPTPEEKEKYFKRNYLRFLTKDLERSSNEGLKNVWERWNADDEIDSIEAVEDREKFIVRAKKNSGTKVIETKKSVKVGKERVRFGMQPRFEIGMVRFDMKTNYFNTRAWLGINGNQELKIERRFKSTGTKAFVNYYIDQSLILTAVDQKIVKNWVFRVTHTKDIDGFSNMTQSGVYENNIAQVRYNVRF